MAWSRAAFLLLGGVIACSSATSDPQTKDADLVGLESPQTLAEDESVIMVVGTNDIHGSFGRFADFGGYMDAARAHVRRAYGDRGELLLLDAGDATQGTLVSNFSEGLLAVKTMSALGYTAAIAGNHGFDFGPVDWTRDQCRGAEVSCDPLEALHRSVGQATFPFLGANVTRRADGKHLDFLPPFTLVPFQGRNVAVLGLENHFTDRTTVPENVAALSFGEGKAELAREVEALHRDGRADVFVLVIHEGDAAAPSMKEFLEGLPRRSNGAPLVDVAIAGHSHRINDAVANEIPYIQSGANGEMFGVVEIVTKKDADGRLVVQRERTRQKAGIRIADRPSSFLLEPVVKSTKIEGIVRDGEAEVALLADEHLVNAPSAVSREGGRTSDSEIGNLLADAMRSASGAEVAMINGGDVRDDLPAGEIRFEHLFQVLPKNLALVHVAALPTRLFAENVRLAIESCGRRGALQISGFTIDFARDCTRAVDGVDPRAVLERIVLSSGQAIFDHGVVARETIDLATTDFVMSGGSGYGAFRELPLPAALPPLRSAVATDLKRIGTLDPTTYARGRYREHL
jgi:2',3'-cyclic-nucleotide 2'-phosphodiesterase (5'-nucleotidase family)